MPYESTVTIPSLQIGPHKVRWPIIQGGMGVSVSRNRLAAAVANAEGVGVIASVGLGLTYNPVVPNWIVLREEINLARATSSGILGVNVMQAVSDHEQLIETAVRCGVDLLFLGAGIPVLPDSVVRARNDIPTRFVIIVSSARAMTIIFKQWFRHYGFVPDAVVVEGPLAGGHLGFKRDQLFDPAFSLETLLPPIVAEAKRLESLYEKPIPVIAAGGVFTGTDIHRMFKLGAQGVQLGTRFAATVESDASDAFKQAYLNCSEEDIVIIDSPVGLPGRAIRNQFTDEVVAGIRIPFICSSQCLTSCNPESAPFCIAAALKNAAQGDMANGFPFAGANAWRVDRLLTVPELMRELTGAVL